MNNKENKFTLKKMLLAVGAVAMVPVIALAALMLRPSNIVSELTVEAGRESLSANEFRKEDKGIDAQLVAGLTAEELRTPGSYPVQIQYKDKLHDCTVTVKDTVAPVAVVRDLTVYSYTAPDPEAFIVSIEDVTNVTVQYEKRTDLTQDGDYPLDLLLTDEGGNRTICEVTLTVSYDSGAPTLSGVKEFVTYLGNEPDYLAGVTATDDREGDLQILVDKSRVDLDTVGTYEIIYSVTDAAGYTATASTTVTVTDDNTAPVIQGVHDISLYLGSSVSYRKGVIVTDDQDPAPKLEVDSSQVDLSKVGTYPVVYIARDMTGNETRIEVTVTVAEKPATYVDEETIYAKVDDLLAKIVNEDMTDEAKVKAIYAHVCYRYGYTSHSDKTDWLQGAWVMMTRGQGDCFNYYALTKLMLERCGIPNIDVRKVRNYETDSDHYWSLVSIDGGKTYYHLDTTPRMGAGDNFCLVTDAFLDAYSAANWNSHNRDKSLYPATPEA